MWPLFQSIKTCCRCHGVLGEQWSSEDIFREKLEMTGQRKTRHNKLQRGIGFLFALWWVKEKKTLFWYQTRPMGFCKLRDSQSRILCLFSWHTLSRHSRCRSICIYPWCVSNQAFEKHHCLDCDTRKSLALLSKHQHEDREGKSHEKNIYWHLSCGKKISAAVFPQTANVPE